MARIPGISRRTVRLRLRRTTILPLPLAVAVAVSVALLGLALLSGACGSSSPAASPSPSTTPSSTLPGHGPVDVLYAGSLVTLMESAVGPAFEGATGYTYSGFSAGSTALASEIRGQTRQGDVFISASPTVNASLTGPANGSWVSWYATFATSPLVIGYNPSSSFASQLTSKPWYDVVTEPGFLLGRTDPATDPKGKLAVEALDRATRTHQLPALSQLARSDTGVYPEETLVGRLQAGQLDAGFFYASEAKAAGIPTIPLGDIHLTASYTVTVLNRALHPMAGDAFVTFLLGHQGRTILTHNGLTLTRPPSVIGTRHVPRSLQSTLGTG